MLSTSYPMVSIVLPCWNEKEDVLQCLNSLRGLDYSKGLLEVIVSDNNSQDGSPEAIRQLFAEMRTEGWLGLKLVENRENLGAPGALNTAIAAANAAFDYIWRLDNDVLVAPCSLLEMVKAALDYPGTGLVGSKIYYLSEGGAPDSKTIYSVGGSIAWGWGVGGNHFGQGMVDDGSYDQVRECEYLPGTSLLASREFLDKVGPFEARYIVMYDDAEWCLRGARAGFKNIYAPKAVVWHKLGFTRGRQSPVYWYYRGRNGLLFLKRNSRRRYWTFLFVTGPLIVLARTAKFVALGRFSQVVAYWRGLIQGFQMAVRE